MTTAQRQEVKIARAERMIRANYEVKIARTERMIRANDPQEIADTLDIPYSIAFEAIQNTNSTLICDACRSQWRLAVARFLVNFSRDCSRGIFTSANAD